MHVDAFILFAAAADSAILNYFVIIVASDLPRLVNYRLLVYTFLTFIFIFYIDLFPEVRFPNCL